ncbi:NUDIX hydrolase domain-like protein [Cladorrhinum sp. PSN259]|nr:NUDIX hydrolase domain-like protein [Cladorrhinum sp. PSN259]
MAPPPPPTPFSFTFSPSLSPFNIPLAQYLPTRLKNLAALKYGATGALVFSRHPSTPDTDRILLLQRAPNDSMPLRWEIPGGACDDEDETVLHGLARELWEESGLVLTNVVRVVGEDVFFTRSGRLVEKVSFEVEVEGGGGGGKDGGGPPEVKLDPVEHVKFLWADEGECRDGKVKVKVGNGVEKGKGGGEEGEEKVMEIEFTTKEQRDVILRGFKLRREERGGKEAASC